MNLEKELTRNHVESIVDEYCRSKSTDKHIMKGNVNIKSVFLQITPNEPPKCWSCNKSIGDKFNLEWPLEMDIPGVVKEADNAMLALEKEVLMQSCDRAWAQLPTPPQLELLFLSPAKAKASFLRRFYSLVEQP